MEGWYTTTNRINRHITMVAGPSEVGAASLRTPAAMLASVPVCAWEPYAPLAMLAPCMGASHALPRWHPLLPQVTGSSYIILIQKLDAFQELYKWYAPVSSSVAASLLHVPSLSLSGLSPAATRRAAQMACFLTLLLAFLTPQIMADQTGTRSRVKEITPHSLKMSYSLQVGFQTAPRLCRLRSPAVAAASVWLLNFSPSYTPHPSYPSPLIPLPHTPLHSCTMQVCRRSMN